MTDELQLMNLFEALKRYANKIGQTAKDIEKNNPLYGQVQRGVRQSVGPIMRNFTSQEEVDRYQGFSQPEQPGIINAGARTAGQSVPYLLPAMATEAAAGSIATKFASHIPAGSTALGNAASMAGKGAVQSAPYGWMAGLPYAESGDERGQNIIEGTLASALLGAVFGAGAGVIQNKISPQVAKTPREYQRWPSGKFAPSKKSPTKIKKTVIEEVRQAVGKKPGETVYTGDLSRAVDKHN